MSLEKIRDYNQILRMLYKKGAITATDLVPSDNSQERSPSQVKVLSYKIILSMLKKWAKGPYVNMEAIPNPDKKLGGPKLIFKVTASGKKFIKEILNIDN